MRRCIPPELFNGIPYPADGQAAANIADFVKSEMSYRLPSVSDVMMHKEVWHVVCNFCERCGALLEKKTGNVTSANPGITISSTTYGAFQRLVGAGIGTPTSIDNMTLEETVNGPKFKFADTLLVDATNSAYLIYSVVPDLNKSPANMNLPTWFWKKYSKLLVAGGMYRILSMGGRPWTDITTARLFAVEFNNEIERVSRSLLTSGMRKYIRLGTEDLLVSTADQSRPQAAAQ